MTRVLVALAVLLTIARTAHAQREEPLPARLAPPTRAAIHRLADSLASEGLPHDLLAVKAAEGVLKQASDERILVAVRALAADLRGARAALDGASTDAPTRAELVAAATALHAGVPAPLLQRVAASPREPSLRATALLVLADLVGERVPASAAADAVGGLLAGGASERRLVALRDDVLADLRRGESPSAAVLTRARERLGPP